MRWFAAALAVRGVPWRQRRRRVGVVVLTAAIFAGLAGSGSGARTLRAGVFTGYGFESCNAPSAAALNAWLASPYRAVGIYIGGVNRSCANTGLTADWVAAALASGWSLIPTYVGLQAPCISNTKRARFTAASAQSDGLAAADDAIAQAGGLGLPAGSPIYFDMEAYSPKDAGCTQAVITFVSAWTGELHAHGFVAGVYGSSASTARDMQALATTPSAPDDLWIANWNGNQSVFGDPNVSDALWTNHQRIHQYRGGHSETFGGVSINIDSDYLDGAVVSSGTAVAPPPSPAPAPVGAGSLTTDDEQASATWPAGALGVDASVALGHSAPGPTLPGYGSGGYNVQLQVAAAGTLSPVHEFAAPITLKFAPRSGRLAPLYSTNGTVWKHVPQLVDDSLARGARAGYARDADGGFVIQTTVAGSFALVADPVPPSPPPVSAHFANGGLALAWGASTDVTGPIVGYRVTLTNVPIGSFPPGVHRDRVSGFHRHSPSVYRIVALDAAGNEGRPSSPVVVLPSARPHNLPKAIPAWAWPLSDWLHAGRTGPRPQAPRIVPAWFWEWDAWHTLPFHLRRAS